MVSRLQFIKKITLTILTSKFVTTMSLLLITRISRVISSPGVYPVTGKRAIIKSGLDWQQQNRQQAENVLRFSFSCGYYIWKENVKWTILLKINNLTRSSGIKFKFRGLMTVKPSSNSWSGHIGRSRFTVALYRIYPWVPSTEVGRPAGSSHRKV